MLNLFVAVIIEGFDETVEGDGLNKDQFDLFAEHWSIFDPMATTFIPADRLCDLLRRLTVLTGLPDDPSEAQLNVLVASLCLSPFDQEEHAGQYFFGHVIEAIARRLMMLVSLGFPWDTPVHVPRWPRPCGNCWALTHPNPGARRAVLYLGRF